MATPATGQAPSTPSSADLEWVKLLWEEWKYRHDNFWNKFYRAVWAVVVCAAAPWIKLDKIGVDLFSQARLNTLFRWGYVVFVFVFFIGTALLLSYEHVHLKAVENKIKNLRGTAYNPDPYTLKDDLKTRRIAVSGSLYLVAALVLLAWWAYYFISH